MSRGVTNSIKIQTRPVCLHTYARHWFKMKGREGAAAPVCQRRGCGQPNPRYGDASKPKAKRVSLTNEQRLGLGALLREYGYGGKSYTSDNRRFISSLMSAGLDRRDSLMVTLRCVRAVDRVLAGGETAEGGKATV